MHFLKNKTDWKQWRLDEAFGDNEAKKTPKEFPCFVYDIEDCSTQESEAAYLYTTDLLRMKEQLATETRMQASGWIRQGSESMPIAVRVVLHSETHKKENWVAVISDSGWVVRIKPFIGKERFEGPGHWDKVNKSFAGPDDERLRRVCDEILIKRGYTLHDWR